MMSNLIYQSTYPSNFSDVPWESEDDLDLDEECQLILDYNAKVSSASLINNCDEHDVL